jgi:protein involved in polysaccharide export with SLBB domain
MIRQSPLLLSAVALLLVGPAQGQEFYDVPAMLQPGDVVRVEVWRQPEFSGEFRVLDDGTIAHPLLQEVVAAGRPVAEVEANVRSFLEEYIEEPALLVEGLVIVPVGGEVRAPDVYTLRLDTSIARAIALAGGPTQRGDTYRVMLTRGGEQYSLNLNDASLRLRDLQVRSGDEIALLRRTDVFRDYVVPWASITATALAIARFFVR